MASLVLSGNTSWSVTIRSPAVSGTTTLTLPATTGTVMVNGSAFSAYRSASQSLTASTWTKAQIDAEEFDTNSNYDNTTNYRFTPTVAGYYQVTGNIAFNGNALWSIVRTSIYKNGTAFKTTDVTMGSNVYSGLINCMVTALIYFNGSTDYVELYGYNSCATSPTISGSGTADRTYFQAVLVRGA